ncbi:MAG: galactose ABC transporter substrate-binding protein [Oscillospiraceae bacterium]|nr:galactose ABC transporter substrate-binding protein [Oscillospiraceae bacterium]MBR6610319.1 galactose ABC transporter substrate-binding protein [Oscillospiraceae bacterium]
MKKVLSLLLAVVMMFSLVACGGGEGGETSDVTTYKVGVAIYQFDDNFMTNYRNELVDYFKTKETDTVKYEVTLVDGKNDMATQTDQIRNFITQGMDIIICNLVQTSSADAIIDEVVAAEIPLVLINREPLAYDADKKPIVEGYAGILDNPTVCYVGADARQSGTYQGEIVLELPDKGDIDGDGVIRYVMVVGDPENIDAQFRTEFSVKALVDAGMEVECLVEQIGNWATDQGQTITANAITAHGDKIDVVFCNNDGMALGAKAAIDAAGLKVGEDLYLLGVDALPEAIELIKEGGMTGTVLNDHIAQSHAAVDAAVDVLAGGEMQNYYWANYAKVDKAYVDAQ